MARSVDIQIDYYQGSLEDVDERFLDHDCLICLEVIEHLDPHLVEALPRTIFDVYQPEIVILSTPNAEFNVHFPELNYGTPEQIFRHNDHRFEWTRQEFQDWCNTQAEHYKYSVSFDGVGILGQEVTEVGHCTQIAVFIRQNEPNPVKIDQIYTHVAKITFPKPCEGQSIRHSRLEPSKLQSGEKTAFSRLFDTSSAIYREIPRSYQLKLFQVAQKSNVIAVLDTGAGKTLVAISINNLFIFSVNEAYCFY